MSPATFMGNLSKLNHLHHQLKEAGFTSIHKGDHLILAEELQGTTDIVLPDGYVVTDCPVSICGWTGGIDGYSDGYELQKDLENLINECKCHAELNIPFEWHIYPDVG